MESPVYSPYPRRLQDKAALSPVIIKTLSVNPTEVFVRTRNLPHESPMLNQMTSYFSARRSAPDPLGYWGFIAFLRHQ